MPLLGKNNFTLLTFPHMSSMQIKNPYLARAPPFVLFPGILIGSNYQRTGRNLKIGLDPLFFYTMNTTIMILVLTSTRPYSPQLRNPPAVRPPFLVFRNLNYFLSRLKPNYLTPTTSAPFRTIFPLGSDVRCQLQLTLTPFQLKFRTRAPNLLSSTRMNITKK